MEQIIKITPAFDKRNVDPFKNYGIHNAEMHMVLKGKLGAVAFTIFTGWFLPHVAEELESKNSSMRGSGAAISYHSHKPLHDYEKDNPHENCDWIGGTCYGDIGFTMADTVFEILVSEGSEAVWKWMVNYYTDIFGKLE